MYEYRFESINESLTACATCLSKRIRRYRKHYDVKSLENALERLTAMEKYISDMRKSLQAEIERRQIA